jgi:hypothetical protein
LKGIKAVQLVDELYAEMQMLPDLISFKAKPFDLQLSEMLLKQGNHVLRELLTQIGPQPKDPRTHKHYDFIKDAIRNYKHKELQASPQSSKCYLEDQAEITRSVLSLL